MAVDVHSMRVWRLSGYKVRPANPPKLAGLGMAPRGTALLVNVLDQALGVSIQLCRSEAELLQG